MDYVDTPSRDTIPLKARKSMSNKSYEVHFTNEYFKPSFIKNYRRFLNLQYKATLAQIKKNKIAIFTTASCRPNHCHIHTEIQGKKKI
jgi:hypothetical protein